jgi:glycosyltransferase involved in cell wall biosynthesis
MATVNVIPVDNIFTASSQVTVLETMMYGKAVIATECVDTSDYITNGVNGILIPPKDIDAMINAINKLWEEKALRHEIGRASRRYIEDNITFKAVSKSMSSLLDDLERNGINLLS